LAFSPSSCRQAKDKEASQESQPTRKIAGICPGLIIIRYSSALSTFPSVMFRDGAWPADDLAPRVTKAPQLLLRTDSVKHTRPKTGAFGRAARGKGVWHRSGHHIRCASLEARAFGRAACLCLGAWKQSMPDLTRVCAWIALSRTPLCLSLYLSVSPSLSPSLSLSLSQPGMSLRIDKFKDRTLDDEPSDGNARGGAGTRKKMRSPV
jgi:hypothetical protein